MRAAKRSQCARNPAAKGEDEWPEGDKGAKWSAAHVFIRGARLSSMSSDEGVPAPSPSAAVLARRASREVKPMREESSSDEDAEEPEEWEDDDETS